MSAVLIPFPDRRGNRPAPINPPQDALTKARAYSYKLALNHFDRHAVETAVQHWQNIGLDDNTVCARAMAMANRLSLSHQPDPNPPAAA